MCSEGEVKMAGKINKFVAFIPVRGGSKSIPLKNIKHIGGQPLVYWTIQAAEECKAIEKIFVSTDDSKIAAAVAQFPGKKINIINRGAETATDTASTESAMLEFANSFSFENIVLLQATSPLITGKDLDGAINLYDSSDADSLLSVVRQKRFIWEENKVEGKTYVLPQNYDPLNRPRRQEFDGFLVENGAFYITSRKALLQTESRLSGKVVPYEMDEKAYIEIDEISDWKIVDSLLREKGQVGGAVNEKAKEIKLFVTDCDGVLTDSGMYYMHDGNELKKFNTKDGMGLALLQKQGIEIALITGENSSVVEHRAKKLSIHEVHLGVKDKLSVLKSMMDHYGVKPKQVAYIGDDINDLEAIQFAGLGIAVSDAVFDVKKVADYVTKAQGGQGAVREACDLIINNLIPKRKKK